MQVTHTSKLPCAINMSQHQPTSQACAHASCTATNSGILISSRRRLCQTMPSNAKQWRSTCNEAAAVGKCNDLSLHPAQHFAANEHGSAAAVGNHRRTAATTLMLLLLLPQLHAWHCTSSSSTAAAAVAVVAAAASICSPKGAALVTVRDAVMR
jgi:hypothetical protein